MTGVVVSDHPLNDLAVRCHATALDKGWYDSDRSLGDILALVHSELSEALEAYRSRGDVHATWTTPRHADGSRVAHKPEGVVYELADAIIRILDYCAAEGLDIGEAVRAKMQFNEGRPHRHGGKAL